MTEDKYLTTAEVAELLRVDVRTVRNMTKRGELAAVRLSPAPNGKLIYSLKDVEACIERHKVKPNE